MKRICILGSTGSIGQSSLSLVDLYPDRFQVVALAAHSNLELLAEQIRKYRPMAVALFDRQAAARLRQYDPGIPVGEGVQGIIEVATLPEVEMVLAAIMGAAGLLPTYYALSACKDVALANKETLVMAGELVRQVVASRQVALVPVDSEHSALHQCLRGARPEEVRRLLLTASGGPFLRKSRADLEKVTVEEALEHPTWSMGPKITIDSATLMNKGLEVIEAHHLFGVDGRQISVIVHPQSIIHSMVEFIDGTVLAQMSVTDMRLAILYALSYPERAPSALAPLDFFSLPALEFQAPDPDRFPCLKLAYEALERGHTFPAALNAANEVAVECFLEGRIPLSAISLIIERVLEWHEPLPMQDLETVLEADSRARLRARELVGTFAFGRGTGSR